MNFGRHSFARIAPHLGFMSAKHATTPAPSPTGRRNRRAVLPVSASALVGAAGVGLLLAAGSAPDVIQLSDAFGTPIETVELTVVRVRN